MSDMRSVTARIRMTTPVSFRAKVGAQWFAIEPFEIMGEVRKRRLRTNEDAPSTLYGFVDNTRGATRTAFIGTCVGVVCILALLEAALHKMD